MECTPRFLASRAGGAARAALGLALAALLGAQASAQPIATWYTSRITFAEGPVLVEHLWAKGRKMRAETVIAGRPLVTLVDESRYVIYDETTRSGISIQRSPLSVGQDADRGRPFGNEAERVIRGGAEKVGSVVLAGRDADRYRLTDSSGRHEVWVTRDELELPIRVLYRDRATGTERRSQYLDWDAGIALADAFFAVPDGVELESIGYEDYVARSSKGAVGPAPPFYADLLHGHRTPETSEGGDGGG